MIILEGPDNGGKTTLGKVLSEALHIPVLHGGGPPNSKAEAEKRIKIIFDDKDTVIYDRAIQISEGIYAPIFRGSTYFNTRTALSKLQKKHNPIIIYCRPPTHRIIKLEEKDFRPGEEVDHIKRVKENQGKIIKAYDELFGEVPHIRYNYMTHTLGDLRNITVICKNYMKGEHWNG
jgi:thymidylate kinase